QTVIVARAARGPAAGRGPSAPARADAPQWLVFADHRGVGHDVAEALSALDQESILVSAGGTYRRIADRRFQIRRERADDLAADLAALFDGLGPRLPRVRGIVHLWSLDAGSATGSAEDVYSDAQAVGIESALALF